MALEVRSARVLAAAAAVLLTTSSTWAREDQNPVAQAGIERLLAATQGRGRVQRSPLSGLARFISVPAGLAPERADERTPEGAARGFLRTHGAAFGLGEQPEVITLSTSPHDLVGMEHVRFQQAYHGIPVAGAELIVHVRGRLVVAANARTVDQAELSLVAGSPERTGEQALSVARKLVAREHPRVSSFTLARPRLEILNAGLFEGRRTSSRLAWFVEAVAPRVQELVWVDAVTGECLLHFDQQPDARQREVFSASNTQDLPGTPVRAEGQDPSGDPDADLAYESAGDTYDYLWSHFGRDSIDGAGQPLLLTVHYGADFQNAFWDTQLEQVAFGEGSARADDVVAHEITHGLTQHTANLFYYRQSGALNESMSDVLGETVDLLNGRGNDSPDARWLASEDWPGVGPIRNMADPTAMGSPGRLGDPQLQCDEFDNGGVHTNSGILNHAYSLAVDGGAYNGQAIGGIGLERAGAVFYRALTTYLTTSSDFADADSALRQSCADLVGTAIEQRDCESVGAALDAVEMAQPWPCAESSVVVTKRGNASGTVTSMPPGIDCGPTCEASFPPGYTVTLLAAADPGAVFSGWGGKCSGLGQCDFRVEGREAVSAGFDFLGTTYPVAVSTNGTGAVVSSPPGIDCGGSCASEFPAGAAVTLSAAAPPGWSLLSWNGDCGGRGACTLTIDGPKSVGATFAEAPFSRDATLGGVHSGQASWGDYDGDGDLDLVVVGRNAAASTTLYRNDAGALVESGVSLAPAQDFAVWGDYDNDGDLDLVLGGWTDAPPWYVTQLYRNDAASSRPSTLRSRARYGTAAAWGDYDNDGDLDLAMAGSDGAPS